MPDAQIARTQQQLADAMFPDPTGELTYALRPLCNAVEIDALKRAVLAEVGTDGAKVAFERVRQLVKSEPERVKAYATNAAQRQKGPTP